MSDNLLPPEVPSRETIARAIWAVKPDCQGKPFPLDTMTPKERRGYDHNPIASLDLCFTYADAALASIPAARSASWREALFPPDIVEDGSKCITTLDASYNLQGALYDLKRLASKGKPADKICIDTIERVVAQLEQARAAPLPSPAGSDDPVSETELAQVRHSEAGMSDFIERLREPVMLRYNAEQVNAERREAAAEIERLRANMNKRDVFLVAKGLWSEFMVLHDD